MSNPNFNELMADLRILWNRWVNEELADRDEFPSKAITKRMCMEDLERLILKYDCKPIEPPRLKILGAEDGK